MGSKIVITGAAGLVGQNLMLVLREAGYTDIVAIDKQAANLDLLSRLTSDVRAVCADLAVQGTWEDEFIGCDIAVILHAQITSKTSSPFVRNNIDASRLVFAAARRAMVPFVIHVSSSVV